MSINNDIKKRIAERKQKLDEVKVVLKTKFFGIDEVIDEIIEKISLWYLMPEVQINPLIISLWGITGVGKTDLVRTLVDLLDFNNKFIEIQMDTRISWKSSIEAYIDDGTTDENEPMILLLDEIQRYRTIDEMGKMIKNDYYNDIWTLLSDGRFTSRYDKINNVLNTFYDIRYNSENKQNNETSSTDDEPKANNNKYKRYYYNAISIKKMLKLKQSVLEIMEMDDGEIMELIEAELNTHKTNDGVKYNQMLIFISGNIDEAYSFSDNVADVDRDADIYYNLSKKVNVIKIKEALTSKFKPEQISRFGNNHVIYPTINKKAYIQIIKNKTRELIDNIKSKNGIDIEISDKFIDVIYRNGVFPAQGVRPLISTINQVCGQVFSTFIFNAICSDVGDIYIDIESNNIATCDINGTLEKLKINLDVDDIKNNKDIDETYVCAVHELGHALVYSLLFKTVPEKIEISGASIKAFVDERKLGVNNKYVLESKLKIAYGGICAEEIVFGSECVSDGSSRDIDNATHLCAAMVRNLGMNKFNSTYDRAENNELGINRNYNIAESNLIIEKMLTDARKIAKKLIENNIELYKDLVDFAITNKSISNKEYIDICSRHGLILSDVYAFDYEKKLNNFLKK